jgi:hypothetical protein
MLRPIEIFPNVKTFFHENNGIFKIIQVIISM